MLRNIAVLLAVVLLATSCCSQCYTPSPKYNCPLSADVVEAARGMVTIKTVNYEEKERVCGGPNKMAAACYKHSIKTVFLYDALSPKALAETETHELCHAYRLQVLGVALADEVAHVGWKGGR